MRLTLAALLLAALLPFAARAGEPPAPVEGTDYVVIEGGTPYVATPGRIEVAEVFAYWCHHCANLAPKLEAWKARQARDVVLRYVPLPGGPNDALAQAYFAAESTGLLARTHAATFRAIHESQSLPKNASAEQVLAFHKGLGLDTSRLGAAMQAPDMRARLEQAYRFAQRSGVMGTPTLVVNGKYRVQGRTFEDMLRIAGQLVARERAARPAPKR